MKCILMIVVGLSTCLFAQKPPTFDLTKACDKIKVIEAAANDFSVLAPNSSLAACVKDDSETKTHLYLATRGGLKRLRSYLEMGPSHSLQWSPDSAYFAFNWTGGGAAGQWHVDLYDLNNRRFRDITNSATKIFLRQFRSCRFDSDDLNYLLLKWTGPRSVLLDVELHPIGAWCEPSGNEPSRGEDETFFEVSVPSGKVVRVLKGAECEAVEKEFSYVKCNRHAK